MPCDDIATPPNNSCSLSLFDIHAEGHRLLALAHIRARNCVVVLGTSIVIGTKTGS